MKDVTGGNGESRQKDRSGKKQKKTEISRIFFRKTTDSGGDCSIGSGSGVSGLSDMEKRKLCQGNSRVS